jgi:hypothetical protein
MSWGGYPPAPKFDYSSAEHNCTGKLFETAHLDIFRSMTLLGTRPMNSTATSSRLGFCEGRYVHGAWAGWRGHQGTEREAQITFWEQQIQLRFSQYGPK